MTMAGEDQEKQTSYLRPIDFNDVWEACYSAGRPLRRREIAALCHRKVTPHLIALIETLVEKEWLERGTLILPNKVVAFTYTAKESGKA